MFKKYSRLFILFMAISSLAQNSVENYKYVLMPSKFSFLKDKNQYRLNSTLKFFFDNKGYETYTDDQQLPEELANNKCKAIFVDLESKNTMFSTKLKVVVKDCNGNILLTSEEGSSREKEYKVAYNQAMLIALKSINNPYFKISPKYSTEQNEVVLASQNKEVAVQNTAVFNILPIDNGYNLINKGTNAIITLLKTTVPNNFIARLEEKNGIVFKKGEQWYFEYYQNGKLVSELLDVKL
jgi:hypothetical protein